MKKITLGGVAFESKNRFQGDRNNVPVVGLEHLAPGEVKLSRWDSNSENTFTKSFRKGEVLFGRRRAYLKKAAVAPFDGICSGDITVIAAKEGKIQPELLPFIIQGERFFDYAVKGSAGSLSPRVKWEHLKNYEFELPPIGEQRKLADLLWAAYELKESYKKLLAATDEMVKAKFIEDFEHNSKFTRAQLFDSVEEMFIGPFGSSLKNECFVPMERSYCMVYEQKHAIQKTMDVETRFVDEKKYKELSRFSIVGGDIIVSCRGTIGEIFSVPLDAPMGIMHPSIMKIRLNNQRYSNSFFIYALERYMYSHCHEANGSGVKMAVTATILGKEFFSLPPIEMQNEFADFVKQADASKAELNGAIAKLEQVMKSLLP